MVDERIVFIILTALGIEDDKVRRALILEKYSSLVSRLDGGVVIAVPSQRRVLKPSLEKRPESHVDLAALARGEYRITLGEAGKLPEDQQVYMVKVTRQGAECRCPDTRYNRDPLCVHKVAAIAYVLDHEEPREAADLLSWLPKIAEEYRKWRRLRQAREA